ncbi:MAG TPA: EamA family transporter RarD [Methylophaga aminisulfidivorans]|uniref:EamA family transporter RarD n=2 Tax=root TaxID=1 RepID=A0A7C1ZTN8_9GAMM|nr:EamA family transporter RarD [Methylophaga sp.]HEC75365.1 EamA family transporter RarD [Methylophaga aminisulfidivorans]
MQGLLLAVLAYSIWGFFPLFFSYLNHVSPVEVLSHRIIWSLVATLFIGLLLGKGKSLRAALTNKTTMLWLAASSILIAINWLVYIWAVGQHRVLEASLGYFIMPLVSLLMGRILLKESLHPLQAVAGVFAFLAVLWELWSFGSLPWVGVVLSFAFAFYGLIRKVHPIDGINGLTIEALWLMPIVMAWFGWQSFGNNSLLAFGSDAQTTILLISSGFLTALPLVLFAMATRRINLSIVGFIMYINPTIQFLIGVYVLNEHFPKERLITFIFVWLAMILFMMGMWKTQHKKTKTTAKVSS